MPTFQDRVRSRSASSGSLDRATSACRSRSSSRRPVSHVRGFDVDDRKIEALGRGESYIKHIGADRVAAAVARGRFTPRPTSTA